MKKSLSLILILFLSLSLHAQQYLSEKQIKDIASKFTESNSKFNTNELQLSTSLTGVKGKQNVYIYHVGNHGFVILSGNTALPPVLGYGFEAALPSWEEAPDNFGAWIRHYSEEIDFAVMNGIKPTPEVQQQWDEALQGVFSSKGSRGVEPLIETRWNQDCYYNEYCPATSGGGWWGGPCGHVYAGCVACAMAQVMKYWDYPEVGFGSHSYVHSTYGQQMANFSQTTYHWDQMPNSVYGHNDAVATLMYHCGVSVNMNYGADGSGAYSSDVETALRSYFGYCGAKYREKSQYSEADWIALMKTELDASRPVYYSGNSGSAGHAFVCDGYDEYDYLHFNFGWSGGGDAYYSVNDVNGYNQTQAAVVNVFPLDIHADEFGIIHVSADGEGNGSSWDNATSRLEYASFLSSGGETQVWVKEGTYYGDDSDPDNAFTIGAGNRIYGGFQGNEGPDFNLNERDPLAHPTILDGQGVKRVLNQSNGSMSSSSSALWDGFIIQNGKSGSGGGVYLNGYVTLNNCIIRDNTSDTYGGGIYVNSTSWSKQINLNRCVITGNTASMGAGVCNRANPTFTNCKISNNIASTKGGGVYSYMNAEPVFRGCIISNNTANQAAGIYGRGHFQMEHCDIVMNLSSEAPAGVYNDNKFSDLYSCILWGNEAEGMPSQHTGLNHFHYCAVQGATAGDDIINLTADNDGEEPGVYPRFIQPAQGAGADFVDADWNLMPRSICLNAGKPGNASYVTDFAGNLRLQHGRVEIGAYELNASLTHIDDYLVDGQPYLFNGMYLHEPGYYTAVFPMPSYDSVVGLNLQVAVETQEILSSTEVLSIEVYTLLGQYVGKVESTKNLKSLDLRSGCYLLRIRTNEGILGKKIVIP